MEFIEAVGKPVRRNVPLREYSNFRIGGAADLFFEASGPGELRAAVAFARSGRIPFYVIGGGYNILFADAGYRGLVIRNRARGIEDGPGGRRFTVLSGTPLSAILDHALRSGLGGLEFLAGIPGTVGGALFMNAGAYGGAVADLLVEAVLLDGEGRERRLAPGEMNFGYRRSILQARHDIVLEAVFEAAPGDPDAIRAGVRENMEKRKAKHPAWGTPCAGSYFKNPVLPDGTKIAAGRLLEEAGAKDCRVGDAAVFSGHANFIINAGDARAADILALAAELKERVRARSGILLEEEVIYLPESFSMA